MTARRHVKRTFLCRKTPRPEVSGSKVLHRPTFQTVGLDLGGRRRGDVVDIGQISRPSVLTFRTVVLRSRVRLRG